MLQVLQNHSYEAIEKRDTLKQLIGVIESEELETEQISVLLSDNVQSEENNVPCLRWPLMFYEEALGKGYLNKMLNTELEEK